jgi:hypothetical protein
MPTGQIRIERRGHVLVMGLGLRAFGACRPGMRRGR